MIETQPCGKAERHNDLALFTLTRLKMMYHAKRGIAPAIYLFMNRNSHATSYHSPLLYLELKLLVELHIAASANGEIGFRKWTPSTDPSPHFPQIT